MSVLIFVTLKKIYYNLLLASQIYIMIQTLHSLAGYDIWVSWFVENRILFLVRNADIPLASRVIAKSLPKDKIIAPYLFISEVIFCKVDVYAIGSTQNAINS